MKKTLDFLSKITDTSLARLGNRGFFHYAIFMPEYGRKEKKMIEKIDKDILKKEEEIGIFDSGFEKLTFSEKEEYLRELTKTEDFPI